VVIVLTQVTVSLFGPTAFGHSLHGNDDDNRSLDEIARQLLGLGLTLTQRLGNRVWYQYACGDSARQMNLLSAAHWKTAIPQHRVLCLDPNDDSLSMGSGSVSMQMQRQLLIGWSGGCGSCGVVFRWGHGELKILVKIIVTKQGVRAVDSDNSGAI